MTPEEKITDVVEEENKVNYQDQSCMIRISGGSKNLESFSLVQT